MAAPRCGNGPLGGAAHSKKHIQTDASILTPLTWPGKRPAIAIEYAPAVFAATLSRGRRDFFLKLRGAANRNAVLLVASVATVVQSAPRGGRT